MNSDFLKDQLLAMQQVTLAGAKAGEEMARRELEPRIAALEREKAELLELLREWQTDRDHHASAHSDTFHSRVRAAIANATGPTQSEIKVLTQAASDAQAALNRAVWHDDKPEERADLHTPTQPGDLDTAGRPLKAGT